MKRVAFITGTDTEAGKTVLACLLACHAYRGQQPMAALKPVCSGGREDARQLRAATGNVLTLDEVNPWHFHAPVAPVLAARKEGRTCGLAEVVRHVRTIQKRFPFLIIEGAGGLLSPLGENFDSLKLICALRAEVIVACPNRLGAVNQALLVVAALPKAAADRARIVLMGPRRADAATRFNAELLREILGQKRVFVLPWLKSVSDPDRALKLAPVRSTAAALTTFP